MFLGSGLRDTLIRGIYLFLGFPGWGTGGQWIIWGLEKMAQLLWGLCRLKSSLQVMGPARIESGVPLPRDGAFVFSVSASVSELQLHLQLHLLLASDLPLGKFTV